MKWRKSRSWDDSVPCDCDRETLVSTQYCNLATPSTILELNFGLACPTVTYMQITMQPKIKCRLIFISYAKLVSNRTNSVTSYNFYLFVQKKTGTYYVWLIDLGRPRRHRFRYFVFFFTVSLVILFSSNGFCHYLFLITGIAEITVQLTNRVLESLFLRQAFPPDFFQLSEIVD